MMKHNYTYKRLPFCDPQRICKALMALEDLGYEIFHIESISEGKEYFVYIRIQQIVPGCKYIIIKDTGKAFSAGDYFTGKPNNILEHDRSGVTIEYTEQWYNLIIKVN